MFKTLGYIIVIIVIWGCSSSENNPPNANFKLSSDNIAQWDYVEIIDESSGSNKIDYTIEGGRYHINNKVIRFLENRMYTVTQTVGTGDKADSFSVEVEVHAPINSYTIDNQVLPINSNAYWYDNNKDPKYLRILAEVDGQEYPNLLKFFPRKDGKSIEGEYVYSDNKETGTYDLGMNVNYTGNSYDWTTNGEGGTNMSIVLIYEDPLDEKYNAYDITLESYTLNYGNWNFIAFEWISDGTKNFSISYRGVIEP